MARKAKKENIPPISLKRIKYEMEDSEDAKDSSEERPLKREKSSTAATSVSRSATPSVPVGHVNFVVHYPHPDKPKDEALMKQAEFLRMPFKPKRTTKEDELDLWFSVQPFAEWESMKRYNNFVISGDTYKNDCFVYVRSKTTPLENEIAEANMKDFWIARVLQVRAKDNSHVYALVAWMYWPDELLKPKKYSPDQVDRSGGKRTYHGNNEVVASNYLEVLDVLSFAGKADVQYWDEDVDGDQIKSLLYWRQTYSQQTQALSPIREHCVCNGHYNPDIPMYICDNENCKVWLHKTCLVDHTLTKQFESISLHKSQAKAIKVLPKSQNASKTKPYHGVFAGSIEEVGETGTPMITIRDLREGKKSVHQQRISCPKCDTELE